MNTMISVLDFGADPTGVSDSTSAILSACANGGKVFFPAKSDGSKASYRVIGSGTYALPFTVPVELIGENGHSSILADASIPSSRPVVGFAPISSPWDANGYGITDLCIEPDAGCSAPNALVLDTTHSGSHMWFPRFKNMRIGLHAGGGFAGAGVTSVNTQTDGLYDAVFEDCVIWNGIWFDSVGDSIHIERCQLWGNAIGVRASFVPGASSMTIKDSNISNTGGCIYLIGAVMADISNNNMEMNNGYSGPVGAMVYLENSDQCDIRHNEIQSLGQTGCVQLNGCSRVSNIRNRMYCNSNQKHIYDHNGGTNFKPDNHYFDSSSGAEVTGYF